MKAASKYAFVSKKKAAVPNNLDRHARVADLKEVGAPVRGLDLLDDFIPEQPDTNVISVHFATLKKAEDNMQMGDPYFCKNCRACLSQNSKLIPKGEYQEKYAKALGDEKDSMEEEKVEERKQGDISQAINDRDKVIVTVIADTDRIWVCEFCGQHNLVNLDPEEMPQNDDVIYMLKSAEQISKNLSDLSSDITTIFCIDNSGSMSVTTEVKGKHDLKHGLSEEEYEMLKQFIEYGADQYLPNQKKDTTFITRKQCVLAAIENQLIDMKGEFPNRKVGLVTFDNDVSVIGDGKEVPEIVTGDKLYKYDILEQIGADAGKKLVTSTVKESAETLIKKFEKLKENGKTALGPALLVSLGLAIQGKQGSRVILCTDGLANVGLGEIDTSKGLTEAEQFYTRVGNFAKEHGVSISVISIKGEGCKLDVIGRLADLTSGSLTRVDPNEITSQFANIMKQEVIATQVEVKLRLHQAMKFRNEAEENLKERASLYEKNVGNVTAQTELTFEYEVRPDEELVEFKIDSAKLESVPFQAQIVYTSSGGDRLMRVITQTLKTTQNLEEAEKDLNVNLLAARALQQQANFAAGGHYDHSNKIGQRWGSYLNKHAASNLGSNEVLDMYNRKNEKIQKVAKKKMGVLKPSVKKEFEEKEEKEGGGGFFDKIFGAKPKSKASPVLSNSRAEKKEMRRKASIESLERNNSYEFSGSDSEYDFVHDAKNCNSNFDKKSK